MVLAVKNPSDFRNISQIMQFGTGAANHIPCRFIPHIDSERENFAAMAARRIKRTPQDVIDSIRSRREFWAANIGVTCVVTVHYRGAEFAVFTVRPSGELAHICGYVAEGVPFREAAIMEFTEEFLVMLDDETVCPAAGLGVPYALRHAMATWEVHIQENPQLLPWVPSLHNPIRYDTNPHYYEDAPRRKPSLALGAGIYIDPFSTSAQVAYHFVVNLTNWGSLPLSLLHAEDRLVNGMLHTEFASPLVLIRLDGGQLTEGFTLEEGLLKPFALTGRRFHVGMSEVGDTGVCLQDSVSWESLNCSRC